jgi:hypothetical protein
LYRPRVVYLLVVIAIIFVVVVTHAERDHDLLHFAAALTSSTEKRNHAHTRGGYPARP